LDCKKGEGLPILTPDIVLSDWSQVRVRHPVDQSSLTFQQGPTFAHGELRHIASFPAGMPSHRKPHPLISTSSRKQTCPATDGTAPCQVTGSGVQP
jgi:hypothetical protein